MCPNRTISNSMENDPFAMTLAENLHVQWHQPVDCRYPLVNFLKASSWVYWTLTVRVDEPSPGSMEAILPFHHGSCSSKSLFISIIKWRTTCRLSVLKTKPLAASHGFAEARSRIACSLFMPFYKDPRKKNTSIFFIFHQTAATHFFFSLCKAQASLPEKFPVHFVLLTTSLGEASASTRMIMQRCSIIKRDRFYGKFPTTP